MWSFDILHEYLPDYLPKDILQIIVSYNYNPFTNLFSADDQQELCMNKDRDTIQGYLSDIDIFMKRNPFLPWRCDTKWRPLYLLNDKQVFQIIKHELEKRGYSIYRIGKSKEGKLSLCWTFSFLFQSNKK